MSNEVTITITVRLPDGVVPDVQYSSLDEPPFPAEAPRYDPDQRVEFRPMTPLDPPSAPLCQHGIPMKRYPAGISKKTGKPYNASWRPSDAGCTTVALFDRDPAAA